MSPKSVFTGPWYPWFVDSMFESERVQRLTIYEEGAYRRALDKQWKKGSLPADPKLFAEVIGKRCSLSVAKKILSEFFVASRHNPERVVNTTLEQIRRKQRQISLKNVERARAAAATRWKDRDKPDAPSNAPSIPTSIAQPLLAPAKEKRLKENKREENKLKEKRRDDARREESETAQNSPLAAVGDLVTSIFDPRISRSAKPPLDSQQQQQQPTPSSKFLEELKQEPKYMHVNIPDELGKAYQWTQDHGKVCTEEFFTSWLDRIHTPIEGIENGQEYRDPGRKRIDELKARVAQRDEALRRSHGGDS